MQEWDQTRDMAKRDHILVSRVPSLSRPTHSLDVVASSVSLYRRLHAADGRIPPELSLVGAGA